MVDIHSHILPMVDDGSKSLECSLALVKQEVELGVTDIICTPHYRSSFNKTPTELQDAFESFKSKVKENGIPVNLYLGQEIFVNNDIKKLLKENSVLTMNGTDYILIEFDFTRYQEISEIVYELKMMGYKPIVAHPERYSYIDLEEVYEIKKLGGYIQVNAESIVNRRGPFKFVKQMFKEGFVDFVASDIHAERVNLLAEAERIVCKKFCKDARDVVFDVNPKRIIKG